MKGTSWAGCVPFGISQISCGSGMPIISVHWQLEYWTPPGGKVGVQNVDVGVLTIMWEQIGTKRRRHGFRGKPMAQGCEEIRQNKVIKS